MPDVFYDASGFFNDPSQLTEGWRPAALVHIGTEDTPPDWERAKRSPQQYRWYFAVWETTADMARSAPEAQSETTSTQFSPGGRYQPSTNFLWHAEFLGRRPVRGEHNNLDPLLPLPCRLKIRRTDKHGQPSEYAKIIGLERWAEGEALLTADLKAKLATWFAMKTAGAAPPPQAPPAPPTRRRRRPVLHLLMVRNGRKEPCVTLPELTTDQANGVAFLLEHLLQGDRVVALRGFAGTGKTTLIPVLQQTLEAHGLAVAVGSPTHRAAMVLKRKGIPGATTLHRLALVPYFTKDYAEASRWLGEAVECHPETDEAPTPAVEGVPYLIATELARHPKLTLKEVRRHASRYGARKALEHLGIAGQRHMVGFGPKRGVGVMIVDEASMVGQQILDLCQNFSFR
jgi:hypothetical protein